MNIGDNGAWARTTADLVAEILMASTNHDGVFLLVEGSTDQLFLARKVNDGVQFVLTGGRANCVGTVDALNGSKCKVLYLGIVDEDYDWNPSPVENLVFTDTRDLESLLIRSSALDAVMVEYADPAKLAALLPVVTAEHLRHELLVRALPFGRIRYLGFIKDSVSLDSIKPLRFFRDDWTYDLDSVEQECVRLGLSDTVGALRDELAIIEAPSDWHLARGHDLLDVLVGGLKARIGSGCKAPEIERLLRQSMPMTEFGRTELFRRVEEWEQERGARVWAAA